MSKPGAHYPTPIVGLQPTRQPDHPITLLAARWATPMAHIVCGEPWRVSLRYNRNHARQTIDFASKKKPLAFSIPLAHYPHMGNPAPRNLSHVHYHLDNQ